MAEEHPDLPPILSAIAEVAGRESALAIARRHGGTRVTVPAIANGNNWLTALVGADKAGAIILQLGAARRIDVPLGPAGGSYLQGLRERAEERERLMAQLDTGDASSATIARALGLTDRAIRFRRADRRRRAALGQGDLFE